MDSTGRTITGDFVLLNPTRDTARNSPTGGRTALEIDSVALFETNVIKNSGSATAFTVFTGITAAITAYCLTNPKACFGSCPTFYVYDGDNMRLEAEGFSSSISPSLEATDIDALYHARSLNGAVTIEMRNEALETHVVRQADILAVPRRNNCRVYFGSDGRFWESSRVIVPVRAQAPEGNCLQTLSAPDWNERFSTADGKDLGAKEYVDVEFRAEPGRTYGLVVGSRQTLLPTYLVYQALAYMGNDAGYWLAEIERKNIGGKPGDIEKLVGGIEVSVAGAGGTFRPVGEINEHGPLAVDMHFVPLGIIADTTVRVQLRMTKGAWRLDCVSLAELTEPVSPVRIQPHTVLHNGAEDRDSRSVLLDSSRSLVTLPGDIYTLHYALPTADGNYELFLESRGYYLEWIRKEWIEEQNAILLAQMFLDPRNALKRLAPEFKRVEPFMEDCFWGSRYAKP
jgi:hypothetical protein